jgi:hypothetical protein
MSLAFPVVYTLFFANSVSLLRVLGRSLFMSPWLMVAWSLQLAGILRLGFRLLGTSLMAAGNSGQYIIAQNKDRPAKYPLVFYYIL